MKIRDYNVETNKRHFLNSLYRNDGGCTWSRTHSEDATDVIHKWLPFHYSFLFVQISLSSLIVMC